MSRLRTSVKFPSHPYTVKFPVNAPRHRPDRARARARAHNTGCVLYVICVVLFLLFSLRGFANFCAIFPVKFPVKFPVNAPRHRPEPDDVRNQSRRDAPQLAMSPLPEAPQQPAHPPSPLRPRRRAAPALPPPPPRRYEHTPIPSHTPTSTAPHAMPKKRARAATRRDDRACGTVGHLSCDCPSAGDGSGDGFCGSTSRGCSSSVGKACYTWGEFGHISRDCPKPSQGLAARVSVLAAAAVKLVACLATGSRRQQWQHRQLR